MEALNHKSPVSGLATGVCGAIAVTLGGAVAGATQIARGVYNTPEACGGLTEESHKCRVEKSRGDEGIRKAFRGMSLSGWYLVRMRHEDLGFGYLYHAGTLYAV